MSDTNKDEASFTLPSSQADRKKIREVLNTIAGEYQMIDDRKASVKDTIEALHEEFKIPKKIIAKLAQTIHKHNYSDLSHESSVFELFYEGIVETPTTTT